jgi:hypothetical protein
MEDSLYRDIDHVLYSFDEYESALPRNIRRNPGRRSHILQHLDKTTKALQQLQSSLEDYQIWSETQVLPTTHSQFKESDLGPGFEDWLARNVPEKFRNDARIRAREELMRRNVPEPQDLRASRISSPTRPSQEGIESDRAAEQPLPGRLVNPVELTDTLPQSPMERKRRRLSRELQVASIPTQLATAMALSRGDVSRQVAAHETYFSFPSRSAKPGPERTESPAPAQGVEEVPMGTTPDGAVFRME